MMKRKAVYSALIGAFCFMAGSVTWGQTSTFAATQSATAENVTDNTAYEDDITVETDSMISIDAAHFPDANFRKYVSTFDKDGDGKLSELERNQVISISCIEKDISSFKGVEYFPNITLFYSRLNKITELDLSKNTRLKNFTCNFSDLKTLDLSNNTLLTYVDMLQNPDLTNLNISKCPEVTFLSINFTAITSIDLTPNTKLATFNCYATMNLQSVKLGNNPALTTIYMTSSKVKDLDLSKCPSLKNVNCSYCEMENLNVSGCNQLEKLNCTGDWLSEMSLDLPRLTELNCSQNLLTTLDVSKCTALTTLDCSNNNYMLSMNIGSNPGLTDIKVPDDPYTILTLPDSQKEYKLAGVDGSRVSNVKNATISSQGVMTNWKKTVYASYDYNCGTANGKTISISVSILDRYPNAFTTPFTMSDVKFGQKPSPKAQVLHMSENLFYDYSTSPDGPFSETVPTAVGTYYVRARIYCTDMYDGICSDPVKFNIVSDTPSKPSPSNPSTPATKANGWVSKNGKKYWYDNGVMAKDKEVYDPGSKAWYWFDADGTMATNKDVFIPTNSSKTEGKWVRYNSTGGMVKGEDYRYDGWYWFDPVTGEMLKGYREITMSNGMKKYVYYDDITGKMIYGEREINGIAYKFDECTGEGYNGWANIGGKDYWYENGIRQGYNGNDAGYRGKEIYDPTSNAWFWLDNVQGGAKATGKDVYQESSGGKWVRYDNNGYMIKGWSYENGTSCYFDLITGAMLKGWQNIDGADYYFDEVTGELR